MKSSRHVANLDRRCADAKKRLFLFVTSLPSFGFVMLRRVRRAVQFSSCQFNEDSHVIPSLHRGGIRSFSRSVCASPEFTTR